MNVADKLNIFTQAVMNEATIRRNEKLSGAEEELKLSYAEEKKRLRLNEELRLKNERSQIEYRENSEIITASREAKKTLIAERAALIGNIGGNVVKKLSDFSASPHYTEHMMKNIKKCIEEYGNIEVTLSRKDENLAKDVEALTGAAPKFYDADYIGGFTALVKSKNVIIDNTFRRSLYERMEDFNPFKII
ncbi:MAG: hypothetical protein LBL35_05445 [Clostridiales bacterium]|jgi:vacuolar-type H+-ATPase subunit E/Vma4|nr:hypothetical protein [Clostridiales bacterium]